MPQKILIVGASIAGLTFALCMKKVIKSKNVDAEIIIYDSRTTFEETGPSYILTQWIIRLFMEMGLGSRLARISYPIYNMDIYATDKTKVKSFPGELKPNKELDNHGLPPFVTVRQCDLLRLLLLALADKIPLDEEDADFVNLPANNSDLYLEINQEKIQADPYSADLARENWFEDEKIEELLPELHLGRELEAFTISSGTGGITIHMEDGFQETGVLLVGADGANSKIREFLFDNKHPTSYQDRISFSGLTRLYRQNIPIKSGPASFRDIVPEIAVEDVYKNLPESSAVAYMGQGGSVALMHLGNGMIAWNLVAHQQERGRHVEDYVLAKKRDKLSKTLAANPRHSIQPSRTGSPADPSAVFSNIIDDTVSINSAVSSAPSSPVIDNIKRAKRRKGGLSVDTSRMSLNLSEIQGMSTAMGLKTSQAPETVQVLYEDFELVLSDYRNLILRLARGFQIPEFAIDLIARMDPNSIMSADSEDLLDSSIGSFSTPEFHPGRVILLGDAACPQSLSTFGNYGAIISISNAVYLSKLFDKHLHTLIQGEVLKSVVAEFDKNRLDLCNATMREVRNENAALDQGIVGNIWRIGLSMFSANKYSDIVERGKFEDPKNQKVAEESSKTSRSFSLGSFF